MQETDVKRVAAGMQVRQWEHTVAHPVHGELTFKGPKHGLPKSVELAQHQIEMDNLLQDLDGDARESTMFLVAAIAGVKVLLEKPVLAEHREQADESGREVLTKVYYDSENEQDTNFLTGVWTAFSLWRAEQLYGLEAVGKGSGEPTTPGSAPSDSSSSDSGSPSTTPA